MLNKNRKFSKMLNQNRTVKFVSWILEIFLSVCAVLMIVDIWRGFTANLLIVSLENGDYDIQKIEFPAIAICDNNKISKKRVNQYALNISKSLNMSFDSVIKNLKRLGNFYDYDIKDSYNLVSIHEMMDNYETLSNNRRDVFDIMKSLVTPCDELLVNCTWQNEHYKCSDIFQLEPTFDGFCCIFNHNVDTEGIKYEYSVSNRSEINGLVVIVQNDPDDYFFFNMPYVGLTVQIFTSTDYPDMSSGSLLNELVQSETEADFMLYPQKFHSVKEIRKYPIELRKCIFNDEVQTVFGDYSYSNCLVECRIKSMLALCECVPFVMPNTGTRSCTLPELPCLRKYEDKWATLYPTNFDSEELNKEKEHSLVCSHCYTDCNHVTYRVKVNRVPLNMKCRKNREHFNIIKVFYEKGSEEFYKQDVTYTWYEIISQIGGIMGIFMGFSYIRIIEIVYVVALKILRVVKNRINSIRR